MKNSIIIVLALVSVFIFTACEKTDLDNVGKDVLIAQENQEAILNKLEQDKEQLLRAASTQTEAPLSTARSNQNATVDFSMEEATVGISILVDGEAVYDIPDCTVSITDNGDFDTYTITAIDRFDEVDNTVTYTLDVDITKADKTILPRPFSIAWGKFSAWPVPDFFLFSYWNAEIVAEDEAQIVLEVPLMDPFSIYRTTIDVETSEFVSENLEGVVRIVASKQ